jgi:hypothetical protein
MVALSFLLKRGNYALLDPLCLLVHPVLMEDRFRHVAGAVGDERDLRIDRPRPSLEHGGDPAGRHSKFSTSSSSVANGVNMRQKCAASPKLSSLFARIGPDLEDSPQGQSSTIFIPGSVRRR